MNTGAGKTLLIVDDMWENLKVLKQILERYGFTVLTSMRGEEALQIMEGTLPSLIILDIKMPDMDGFEVCSRLKKHPDRKNIPVIFISGLADTENKIKAYEVGGVDYVTKPFQQAEILARVNTHINLYEYQKELERTNQDLLDSEEKFRAMADAAHSAIIMIDSDGNIVFWNKAAESTFGWKAEEVQGKNAHHLLAPHDYLADSENGLSEFKSTGKGSLIGQTHELTAKRINGTTFPVEGAISSVFLDGKWNAIGIFNDITKRKQSEEELRQYMENLERFGRLSVGRETRMIKLKEEVNGLLNELGRENKYRIAK